MQFAGPDIMVSKFQVDVIVVTANIFTEKTLQRAATRLLIAWPFLSFRTNPSVSSDVDYYCNVLTDDLAYCRFEACR
jgi:hypothetical protein